MVNVAGDEDVEDEQRPECLVFKAENAETNSTKIEATRSRDLCNALRDSVTHLFHPGSGVVRSSLAQSIRNMEGLFFNVCSILKSDQMNLTEYRYRLDS